MSEAALPSNNAPASQAQLPSTPAGPSVGERVVRATAAISVAYAAAKLLSLVQYQTIGYCYGLGNVSDAFFASFGLLTAIFLVGEEQLAPAFMPVFNSAKEEEGEKQAWFFASTILNLYFLALIAVVVLILVHPETFISAATLFGAEGQKLEGSARSELAAHFLRGMAPGLLGLSLASVTYTILVSYKRFFWPAIAEAGLKAALVAGILVGRTLGLDEDALVAGVLAAGATKIAIHLAAVGRRLKYWRPKLTLGDARFRQFLVLVAPLIAGVLFSKFRDYFNYIYVTSALEEGWLSKNSYGRQLSTTVDALLAYPLAIALLPFLLDLAAKEKQEAVAAFVTRAGRMLLLILVPFSAVMLFLSVPMAQLLYQVGKVSPQEAGEVGMIAAVYALALPFLALEKVLMQAYFSARRTLSVTIIGIFTSSCSMAASFVGVLYCRLEGLTAVMLIAASYAFSKALKSAILATYLKRRLPVFPLAESLWFWTRLLLIAAFCAGAANGVLRLTERFLPAQAQSGISEAKPGAAEAKPEPPGKKDAEPEAKEAPKTGSAVPKSEDGGRPKPGLLKKIKALARTSARAFPRLALPGLAALVVFVLGCKALRMKELDEMTGFVKEKLRRKLKSKAPPAA